jgi:hypothetical protein
MRFFIAVACILLNSAIASGQFAEFSFSERICKFDAVQEGTPLSHNFTFTNTGEVPLVITGYHVECSCTRAEYPKEPVMPGQQGIIHVAFDTRGKTGWQYRKILLDANTRKGSEYVEIRVKVNHNP